MRLFYKINYKQLSDEALMLHIKKCNNKAFDELYNRYSKILLNFFYKKLYGDQEKANDLLQDLFLKIIEKPELFDTNKKFSTWIYTVAYNMCKNVYRSNIIKEKNYDINLLKELPTFDKLNNKYDVDFFIDSLNTELNNLSKKHKQTFNLRHKDMLSIKEISIVMNCSEGTVKSRLFYATKELSKKLQIFNINKEAYYEN